MLKRGKTIAITLMLFLLSQLWLPFQETVANGSLPAQAMQSDDLEKITVEQLDQHEGSIEWLVTVNPAGKQNEGVHTEVMLGPGLAYGAVADVLDVEIMQTDEGFSVKTPAGNQTYTIELTTNVTDPDQRTYTLQVVATYPEGKFTASATAVTDDAPSNSDREVTDDGAVKPDQPEGFTEDDAPETIQDTSQDVIQDDESPADKDNTSNELTTDDDVQTDSDQTGESAANQTVPPFLSTVRGQALNGNGTSALVWPNPGAIHLDKKAVPTNEYGEWEITLKVEGKNIETSSDVVLVFDKSESMRGTRLSKAKVAAKEFVDNLLTEDSATRIALVTFNQSHELVSDFTSYTGKESLKHEIDAISVAGGTNIQAGLHQAQTLLNDSTADNKVIVLLSDGAPTYSFRASQATHYTWPSGKYDFVLFDFNYNNRIGDGIRYNLSAPLCIPFIGCFGGSQYDVSGYTVKTNGIATLSEAKAIMDSGTTIYSVGLDVGNDADATYVLENSQNGGSYIGGVDDLSPAFEAIASEVRYAAKDAMIIDPMGDMFDLVMQKESISPNDYTVSQGTATWDPDTETFTWQLGNVVEGHPATLTYRVTFDFAKNPSGDTLYPTNGETPIHYTDVNGEAAVKLFPIPLVGLDKGSIVVRGYLVNVDGDPINQNGDVVPNPQLAHQFYSEYFEENGDPALGFGQTYTVPAKEVTDHTVIIGDNPTIVQLDASNPSVVVWFGYVKTSDIQAGDVTAIYVDENGERIADDEVFSGRIGEEYTTEQKDISGYVFKTMGEDSAPASGVFKQEAQTVIYVYKKRFGSITVTKVDAADETTRLRGATFALYDANDALIATETTNDNGELVFDGLERGDYYLVETEAPTGYRLLLGKIGLSVGENDWHVKETVTNTKNEWEIPKTGGIGTLGFYGLGLLLMVIALWYLLKKSRA